MAKRLSTSQLDAIAWSIGEARQTLKYDNDAIDTIAEAIADKRDSMYNESDPELVAKRFGRCLDATNSSRWFNHR